MECDRQRFDNSYPELPTVTMFADLCNGSVDGGVEGFKHACWVNRGGIVGINEIPTRELYLSNICRSFEF